MKWPSRARGGAMNRAADKGGRQESPRRARWRLSGLLALGALFLASPLAAGTAGNVPGSFSSQGRQAQTEEPAVVVADQIVWLPAERVLAARGHVEIFHKGRRLTASAIIYDHKRDRVKIVGPLRLEDEDQHAEFVASEAELDADLRRGILLGARMVVGRRFEFAAERIEKGEKVNRLRKVAASICKPCQPNAPPLWEIRAREVIHDPETRRIRFSNATFALYGTPILWLPALSVPEPGVERATGFLVPRLANSTRDGLSLEVPYFITLGPSTDLTLTPRVATAGNLALAARWRQRWRRGALEAKGAIATEPALDAPRAFVLGRTAWMLPAGWRLDGRLELTSDERFMEEYGYSDKDRLFNGLAITRQNARRLQAGEVLVIRSLRTSDNNDTLPNHILEGRHLERRLLGSGDILRIDLAAGSFLRSSAANVVGRDQSRIAGRVDWQRQRIIGSGMRARGMLSLAFDARTITDDNTVSTSKARVMPTAVLDLDWPLVANTAHSVTQSESWLVVPRAQIVLAPEVGTVPNDDSTFSEIDGSNLFALDRLSGLDGLEDGSRLTLAFDVIRRGSLGDLRLSGGQIFRFSGSASFSSASGLSGQSSDFFIGADWSGRAGTLAATRIAFGSSGISRAESRLRLERGGWSFGLDHLWKTADPAAGISLDRNEIDIAASRKLRHGWIVSGGLSHDFANGSSSRGEIGLAYESDCAIFDLSLSHNAASSTSVSASTSITLKVTFKGLGADAGSADRRQCGPGG